MIILDKPFISDEMKEYLNQSQPAVLENETALSENRGHRFNIVNSEKFIRDYEQAGRIYTASENSIDWIYRNIPDPELIGYITIMKNKVKFRELLKAIHPEFFYREVLLEDLGSVDFETLPVPFVIKPSVGFFSVGVYTITSREDWNAALDDISANLQNWKKSFPDNVVDNAVFILEEYISGEEYAVDAYYDEYGDAVILNIMQHDFSSISDVSDRLYYTGKEIIEDKLPMIEDFLNEVNAHIRARNFPLHAEVRIEGSRIMPIEFNPMRFAGWCCTDLVYFAFGFKTYDYYLNNRKPDWETLLQGKENKLYTLVVLDKPKGIMESEAFDYDRLCSMFGKVLCIRKLDHRTHPVFGFLFTETDLENRAELDYIIKSDLSEFILNEKQTTVLQG